MSERLLTYHDLTLKLNLTRTTLWGLVKRGEFPQPIKIARCVRFRESDVDRWIADQAAAQTGAQAREDGSGATNGGADDGNPAGAAAGA